MSPILAIAILAGAAAAPPPDALPLVIVDRDDVEIAESCRLRAGPAPIADADGDGVVHVTADGVTVIFEGDPLRGAAEGKTPDRYAGTGIHVAARDVTLEGAAVRGFKVAIRAVGADGLVLRACDVSDNFRQRLGSTPAAEDSADWLWPHANDDHEWARNYGAGILVEGSREVTIAGCRARDVQNGIILDRVERARVADNDCSFLSGWGLAMWRSTRCRVERNAFDFCVRGYSHGVYNRGQDSAGILAFEQCSDNAFVGNSVTHGGDGFFCFAGREALGETSPREDVPVSPSGREGEWYRGRGGNRNLIQGNDFSDAAAHGVELTFGFDNVIVGNRICRNAICGIWGGYSQRTLVTGNEIERNGESGYGLERGGVNVEHGHRNVIADNSFLDNACGVHLWWDADEGLADTPWAKANGVAAGENAVENCRFDGEAVAVHLRDQRGTTFLDGNGFARVGERVRAEGDSPVVAGPMPERPPPRPAEIAEAPARPGPIGARRHLQGREHIVMTEWGPYDWEGPLLSAVRRGPREHVYRLLGADAGRAELALEPRAGIELQRNGDLLHVVLTGDAPVAYELRAAAGGETATARGILVDLRWDVRVFAWENDPRDNAEKWRAEAKFGVQAPLAALDLRFGQGGPASAAPAAFEGVNIGNDRFGTIATGRAALSPGRWRIVTTSDDGIRVWIDGALAIDDWTWHAPKRDEHVFTIAEARTVELRVEHFELDGWAVLTVELEPAAEIEATR